MINTFRLANTSIHTDTHRETYTDIGLHTQ